MGKLIKVLYKPGSVFKELKRHPIWLAPFLAITSAQILLMTARTFLPGEEVGRNLLSFLPSIGFVLVGNNLLTWGFIALFAYLVFSLLHPSGTLSFASLFATVTFASVVPLIGFAASVLVKFAHWFMYGASFVSEAHIVNASTVLSGTEVPAFAITALQDVNVFTLWYLAVLSLGLSTTADVSRRSAVLVVLAGWLIGVGLKLAGRWGL